MGNNKKKTVLIVDDEEQILDILKETLEPLDVRVLLAGNGVQGLEILENEKVDVVITDIKMPKMNGIDMLGEIRKRSMIMPVIMITGFAEKDLVKGAWQQGAFDFLHKPLVLDEVVRITELALSFGWDYQYYKNKSENPKSLTELKVEVHKELEKVIGQICKQNAVTPDQLIEYLVVKHAAVGGKL